MKAANVSVALLNGYGDESTTTGMNVDVEDDRRRQRVKQRRIGSNRRIGVHKSSMQKELEGAGIGDSKAASRARVKARVDKALQGTNPSFTNLITAIGSAAKEERVRKGKIRKGGGAAARILAEEDRLRKAVLEKAGKKTKNLPHVGDDEIIIKPGEASLAAAFSCLRPAIDGVDAIMRAGIASAAYALEIQQTIALNCLMSCYNLATLYRDGFRYGSKMWIIELFFITSIDTAGYAASCSPRPRLALSRPPASMFHPMIALSIFVQAAIHLTTLTAGVNMANALGSVYDTSAKKRAQLIRWRGPEPSSKPTSLTAVILNSLAGSTTGTEEGSKQGLNIFGRPPFRPNYTTNVVFLMSIFQNTVTSIVNHKGKPFCGSILESRQFCIFAGTSLLFVIACIAETFPHLNALLELRSLPSRKFRLCLVALLLINFAGCFAADWACSVLLNPDCHSSRQDRRNEVQVQTAADEEELLLSEESKSNKLLLATMLAGMIFLIVDNEDNYRVKLL